MSVRALVLGGTGMLGRAFTVEGRRRGYPVLALSHAMADVMDSERLIYWARSFHPEVILNCAAYTKVDDCETNPATAFAINELGAIAAGAAAAAVGARLLQISSDYVFGGEAGEPYREDAPTGPLSVYGESKLAAEQRALAYPRSLVVRTSWLFGPGGPNFVATILGLLRQAEEPLAVVDDQTGCPTYTVYLARALWDLARLGAGGIVHYCNREPVTWCGFAHEIARLSGAGKGIRPVATAAFPRPARRPAYSVLDTSHFESLVHRPVEPWARGLGEYLALSRPDGGT